MRANLSERGDLDVSLLVDLINLFQSPSQHLRPLLAESIDGEPGCVATPAKDCAIDILMTFGSMS